MTERWIATPPRPKGRCRWCGAPITDPRRRSWCGQACVDQYLIRRDPQTVRRKVFERDHGICALCGVDCVAAQKEYRAEIRRIHAYRHRVGLEHRPYGYSWAQSWWPDRVGGVLIRGQRIRRDPTRSWWEADHIVPVSEGGGGCGLDNYRTLCWRCHPRETGKLRQRLNRRTLGPPP